MSDRAEQIEPLETSIESTELFVDGRNATRVEFILAEKQKEIIDLINSLIAPQDDISTTLPVWQEYKGTERRKGDRRQ